jgi:hypothetical protein
VPEWALAAYLADHTHLPVPKGGRR